MLPPIVMNILEKRGTLRRMPWIAAPLQVALCGVCLTFATPACCALFPQKSSIAVSRLEPEVQVSNMDGQACFPLEYYYFFFH